MKIIEELDYNTGVFGDFLSIHDGGNAILRFEYFVDGREKIGEFRFDFCLSLSSLGMQENLTLTAWNTLFLVESNIGFDHSFNKYKILLSSSDFEFTAIARNVRFNADAGNALNDYQLDD